MPEDKYCSLCDETELGHSECDNPACIYCGGLVPCDHVCVDEDSNELEEE